MNGSIQSASSTATILTDDNNGNSNGHSTFTMNGGTTTGSHTTNPTFSEKETSITTNKETMYEILQRWYKLLFTKEDYFHHHKTLGISCLLSFLVRFVSLLFYNDMGFQQYPQFTIPTIVLHLLLSISSFQFKIPIRRIRDGGRIWPQYRYHSLIFTMRSLLLMALFFYEDQFDIQPPLHYMNFVIIMAVTGSAEYVNYMVGEEQRSNTIRELDGSGYVKFLFSTMQYNAVAVFLIGIRSYSLPFYALFTIQLTPFIGTLRRKMIFTSNFWGAFLYGSLLVGGFSIQAYQYHLVGGERLHLFGRSVGLFAALLRFSSVVPKSLSIIQNKFVIWTVMFMIIQHYRSINFDVNITYLRLFLGTVIILLSLTAHHKVQSGYYPKDVKHAKLMKMASSADQKSA